MDLIGTERRKAALERARTCSPFLREAIDARPELAETFVAQGSEAAVALALADGEGLVEVELRRARLGLALAVALGDLAGELALEDVTRLLSKFADQAIDRALTLRAERSRVGSAGQRQSSRWQACSANQLLDVDSAPVRPRSAGLVERETRARRVDCRRIIGMLPPANVRRLRASRLRLRPSPEVTPVVCR